jgi:hypothetical protein
LISKRLLTIASSGSAHAPLTIAAADRRDPNKVGLRIVPLCANQFELSIKQMAM